MPELIEKIEALGKLQTMYIQIECACGDGNPVAKGVRKAYKAIERMPTIEPKRGEWVETEPDEDDRKIGIEFSIKCSRCHDENSHLDFNENHEITGKTFWKSRFCPNCGADMREEGADNG